MKARPHGSRMAVSVDADSARSPRLRRVWPRRVMPGRAGRLRKNLAAPRGVGDEAQTPTDFRLLAPVGHMGCFSGQVSSRISKDTPVVIARQFETSGPNTIKWLAG